LGVAFEHDDFVTGTLQFIGTSQSGDPGSDHGDAFGHIIFW
jgi:hypothetical protein